MEMPTDLPEHLRFDRALVERNLGDYTLGKIIRSVLHDAERIPEGGCLMVGNHGPLAIDTGLLVHALYRDLGLIVRPLADRRLIANPLGRRLARGLAGVEGSPDNAHALLTHGEKVLVYPGGARETTRAPSERYQLDWGSRLGFARAALNAHVPIVPVACVGLDDLMGQLVDAETVRNSPFGQFVQRFVKPDVIPPVYFPKLRPTQLHYFFGEPIPPNAPDASNIEAVRALQQKVKTELEALLVKGLEVRREKLGRQQA
ncbi:MAG TPA: lysophospholipid acyltransferase family protein [Polyangiales bacterium]